MQALSGQVQALSGQVAALQTTSAQQGARIAGLETQVADLEALDTDDDGDGVAEHAFDDCDDAEIHVFPGATEIPGNGVDEDCNGTD